MGRGFVRSQHGLLPCPAPATLLCLRGVPTYDAGIDAELVTPTGACLLRAVAREFTRWPNLSPLRVGWGAGTRELPDRPNLLRLVLGEPTLSQRSGASTEGYVVIELNVDDLSGEIAAVALARAQERGALDVWSTPIGMKKGRPALMLSALARRTEVDAVARALLSETTSLGVRLREVGRIERSRRMVDVHTPYGTIAVKVAGGDGLPDNVAPEYEDLPHRRGSPRRAGQTGVRRGARRVPDQGRRALTDKRETARTRNSAVHGRTGLVRARGLIGDVHTERTRLDGVLRFFAEQKLQRILCTGDLPDGPNDARAVEACCEALARAGARTISGNHDRWLQDGEMRDLPGATDRDDLSEPTLDFLAALPGAPSSRRRAGWRCCATGGRRRHGRRAPLRPRLRARDQRGAADACCARTATAT